MNYVRVSSFMQKYIKLQNLVNVRFLSNHWFNWYIFPSKMIIIFNESVLSSQ